MSVLLTTGIFQQQANMSQKQYALSFDGVDDYVKIFEAALLKFAPSGSFTKELKVFTNSYPSKYYVIHQQERTHLGIGTNSGFYDYINDFYSGLGQDPTGFYYVPEFNVWYNAAIVYNNENLKTYIDGVLTNESTRTLESQDGKDLFLGAVNADNLYCFDGNISDFRIWNTARTQQQIQDNLDKKLTGNETGLVAYYDFLKGEGNILPDVTGNGNDGEINGATWILL